MSTAVPQDLRERLARAGVTDVRPMPGGASSLTYRGMLDARPVVVKVAPQGVAPVGHRDVLRQARMLRALGPTTVPVPGVALEDPGEPPARPPLFAMSLLEGDCVEPLFDVGTELPPAETVATRFHSAATVLARLHRVDTVEAGVAGEPVVSPRDEIDRWSRALQTVDPALAPGWRSVQTLLESSVPAPMPPVIVHGDFRLGNLLVRGTEVTGVIDWEIWSLSDPRIDLGWFLVNCDPMTYRRTGAPVPAAADLIATYRDQSGAEPRDLGWFQALACFKSAATWSLIVKHNRRRTVPDPGVEAMAGALPGLLDRARHFTAAARRAERGRPRT
nr:phosphotransferase family protein [Mycolicibacterium chubuense]